MQTQEVYEHFIVSLVLNKKILGEIARDSFSEIIYVDTAVLQEVEEFPFN